MASPKRGSGFLAWEDILTTAELDAIEQYGDAMVHEKAVIAVPGANDDAVRVTQVAWLEHKAETDAFYQRFSQIVRNLNAEVYRFDITGLENLQYAVYHGREGGHYDWHIDYGPQNPRPRKLSLTVQLSEPSAYEGGELQFQAGPQAATAPKERGTIIVFPSFFLHRVTPVTSGTRKSLVIWAAGPEFR
jgi:PKHD-type hydroxylase